jgi:hypothetical protein
MHPAGAHAGDPARPLRELEVEVARVRGRVGRAVTKLHLHIALGGAIAISTTAAYALVESHSNQEERTRAAEFGTDRAVIGGFDKRLDELRETLNRGFSEVREDLKALRGR